MSMDNNTHTMAMGKVHDQGNRGEHMYDVTAVLKGMYWTVYARNGGESAFMANGKSMGNALKSIRWQIRKRFPHRDVSLVPLDY
jgi:hypothetical protein